MGLESVIEEIELSAKAAERSAIAEATADAKAITGKAMAEAKAMLSDAEKEAEHDASAMRQRELSALRLKLRRDLLNSKKQIAEQIHAEALKRLCSAGECSVLLKKLLERAQAQLPNAATAYVNKADSALLRKLAPNLKVKGLGNSEHGIILEDANGEIRVNYTVGPLLETLFSRKLADIYAEVFGSGR